MRRRRPLLNLWKTGRGLFSSVRGKVIGIVLLTTAIALLVAGAAMLTQDLGTYRRSWASDLATQASILSSSIMPAVEFDDQDAAEKALSALRARPEVGIAALYGSDGSLYALYRRSDADAVPSQAPVVGEPIISGDRVEVTRKLTLGKDYLGTLYLRANYDLVARIRAYLSIFAAVIGLSMTVAFVLSSRLQRIITAPLGAMSAVARGIIERRDYSLRARKFSSDEIGTVVDAFNRMLEQVQWHAQALEESNELMREADQRKDEFLATLAHELRNPLAPIQHAIRILESKANETQQRWARDVIVRQAPHGAASRRSTRRRAYHLGSPVAQARAGAPGCAGRHRH
jgi:methyl-accepting chemotaxis protein